MYLISGLGNPGKKYLHTRHNVGFACIDQIISDHSLEKQSSLGFDCEIYKGKIAGRHVMVMKPLSFMNNSGQPIFQVLQYYKVLSANLVVIYDEMNLACGRVDSKIGGGGGTHNGLKSINELVPDNYMKIRIGIGRPAVAGMDATSHVLGKFAKDEQIIADEVCGVVSELASLIMEDKYAAFQEELRTRYPK